MGAIIFTILFPIVIAFAFLVVRSGKMREVMVYAATVVIAAGSVVVAVEYFPSKGEFFSVYGDSVRYIMLGLEVLIALYIVYIGIKHRNYLAAVLALTQTAAILWFEISNGGHIDIQHNLQMDKLSVIMILITAVIGSGCSIYGLGYVKATEAGDQRETAAGRMFFAMFLTIGAMIGLFSSNNTTWMYFFWQVITLSTFWLVAHTGGEDDVKRGFRGLNMNLMGGLAFVIGIFILGMIFGTVEFSTMLIYGRIYGNLVLIPATFIVFAGVARSALMPFSSWLTKSMRSPAPAVALINATVVNGGVFLIIRMASLFSTSSYPGIMIMTVGGVTFLIASFAAVNHEDVRTLLGYSTVGTMGIAIACAGLGKAEALWAAIMLVIFHSIVKPLLVMCFGTAERIAGSRMEDLEGLTAKAPRLGIPAMTGIAGMTLAPFGVIVCIWAALNAFADSGYLTILCVLCFGLAAVSLCWFRLLGSMSMTGETAGSEADRIQEKIGRIETIVQASIAALSVFLCLGLPLVSTYVLVPYLKGLLGGKVTGIITSSTLVVVVIMITLLILAGIFLFGRSRGMKAPIYLSGVNKGDDRTYYGAMGEEVRLSLGSMSSDSIFEERRVLIIGGVVTTALLAAGIGSVIGNLIGLMGGGAQ